MKWLIGSILIVIAVSSATAKLNCYDSSIPDVPQAWIDLPSTSGCVKEVRRQIQAEVDASLTYLAMGAHFAQDTVNRPGFSHFFFKAAGEEREHAHKLIEYLLMRGQLIDNVSDLIKINVPSKTVWKSGVEALKDALNTEAEVTKSIRRVISVCENDDKFNGNNDYHIVDYLTGDFLEEQYHGQRELAGMVSTLDKMMKGQGALAEFLYDKKLLA